MVSIIPETKALITGGRSGALIRAIMAAPVDVSDDYIHGMMGTYCPAGGQYLLDALRARVQRAVGTTKIYPSSTFGRIAVEGSCLDEHRDRTGLDWAVSITLSADRMWSLQALEGDSWVDNFTAVGFGLLVNSSQVLHRRLPYEGKRHLSIFVHYTEDAALEGDSRRR